MCVNNINTHLLIVALDQVQMMVLVWALALDQVQKMVLAWALVG